MPQPRLTNCDLESDLLVPLSQKTTLSVPLFFFWHMSFEPFLNADSDSLAALQEINEDDWFLSTTHHWLVITCYHSITCLQYCQIFFLYVSHNDKLEVDKNHWQKTVTQKLTRSHICTERPCFLGGVCILFLLLFFYIYIKYTLHLHNSHMNNKCLTDLTN